MKTICLILLANVGYCFSGPADKNYPVSDIPEELKKGMYAVVRERSEKITIQDIGHYTYTYRLVITILNKNAERFAYESVDYDKLKKVNYFRGVAYDAEGNQIKKLKPSDIYDRSYVSSASLFEDTRVKYASLEQTTFPYTVEFEYEQQHNFLYDFPDFDLYTDDEVSTQKASFVIAFNPKFPPRYKTFNVGEPKKAASGGFETYTWDFENVIPEKFEPYSERVKKVPHIMASPTLFEYSGFNGNMSSWEGLAKWKTELLAGRDELPEQTKQKIQEITKSLPTQEEKIKAVYEFVQSKTRYVNISLGIGGLQPFPAKVVDEVGYGDCKGLSNYTIALLKSIGIQGLYATIRAGAGAEDVVEDFPSHQSNHVIVAVPNGQDTIWLECTSQTKAAGYMGTFTGNRKALINTPSGGKLVKTPSYPSQQNSQTRSAYVTLDASGDATATVRTTYSGLQSENSDLDMILTMGADKQREWLQQDITLPNFDIVNFTFEGKKSRTPSIIVNTKLSLRKLAVVNGKRVFLSPNLMSKSNYVPAKIENRKNKVFMGSGYIDIDTVEFTIPDALYPEFTPEPTLIKSRFGEYTASFTLNQGKLLYIRKLKFFGGAYPPESYNELIEFHKNFNKADNIKVVFVNKT